MRVVEDELEALRARAQEEIDQGHLPSCQYAIAHEGEVLVAETLGDAPPDARYCMFSCTKPIVASVIWQLVGEGALDVAEPVASMWPGFARNGKDAVTIEQVMLHTSGFPLAEISREAVRDRGARIEAMESWELASSPGANYAYHALSAHWVLAELIAIVTGDDHRVAVRDRVLDPLGLSRLELGVPREEQSDIQALTATMEQASVDEIEEALGFAIPPALLEVLSAGDDDLLEWLTSPEAIELGVPGGGAISDASSLALFYQALLHDPKGLWDPAVLDDAKTNVRNNLPDLLGRPGMRSLGLELAGDDEQASGRIGSGATSAGTFGHGGAAGQIALADPETGVSFVFLTNGNDRNVLRQIRRTAALTRLASQTIA